MYEELKKLAEDARDNCPTWYHADCFSLRHLDGGDGQYIEAVNPRVILELIAENEELKAKHAECAEFIDQASLDAEDFEAMRKDAERYRFIRDADRSDGILDVDDLGLYAMESLDEVVDEAMLREGEVRQ